MASLEPQPSVDSESEKDFKIVVIGDGAVGKTAMCEVFAKGTFPDKYAPTVFEAYPFDMKYENQVLGCKENWSKIFFAVENG